MQDRYLIRPDGNGSWIVWDRVARKRLCWGSWYQCKRFIDLASLQLDLPII
jgi:hypothetical protein